MLGIAVVLLVEPGSRPHDDVFRTVTWSARTLEALFAVGGVVRMLALYANGHWPTYGPRMRAGCALLGGIVWSEMALSIVAGSAHPSVDVAVFSALALGEFYSSYRAAGDGRASQRA